MKLELKGRIDSGNAAQVEQELLDKLSGAPDESVELDADALDYISSAGLRVILRLKKNFDTLRITNVHPEVYEILEMTGFTEMMPVEKAYRVVSVDGCEEIGRGANGTIYRIDRDNVVKVYNNPSALDDIRHEREVARLALILGLPTAISYDVVRVGSSYGSVFELLNARSFSQILASEPEKMDWCVQEFASLLKKIHGTAVPEGKLPDEKARSLSLAADMRGLLSAAAIDKLQSLIEAVPDNDHMIHGDYHTKNVMLQNDEVMIIDMDTLSVGDPIFELAGMVNAFVGFSELDHSIIQAFQGFDYETGRTFLYKVLGAYLGTTCPSKIREVEDKARILSDMRIVRHIVRHGEDKTEAGRAGIEYRVRRLEEMLAGTDTLCFSPDELELDAAAENLAEVQTFVEERLARADCPPKTRMHIAIAVEEIFVNIASYAYAPGKGKARVRVEVSPEPVTVTITFVDHGVPYDPLTREAPDTRASAEERNIGGLGIFMTRKLMDDVVYRYSDGANILKLKKDL